MAIHEDPNNLFTLIILKNKILLPNKRKQEIKKAAQKNGKSIASKWKGTLGADSQKIEGKKMKKKTKKIKELPTECNRCHMSPYRCKIYPWDRTELNRVKKRISGASQFGGAGVDNHREPLPFNLPLLGHSLDLSLLNQIPESIVPFPIHEQKNQLLLSLLQSP